MKPAYHLIATAILGLGFTSLAQGLDMKGDKNHVVITPQELTWVDGPEALPKGMKMVILEGNPAKAGPFTLRLKAPAHYQIPAHWHPAVEHVTVLQGSFFMGHGDKLDESKGTELTPGSFAMIPIKTHHYAWTGNEEAIIQLHGIGPWGITYINPKDDPRK